MRRQFPLLASCGLAFFLALLVLFLMDKSGIGCPFYALLHIPCPTCGTTRALRALLSGSLSAYWHYQPMALPLLSLFLLYPFLGQRAPGWMKVYAVTVATVNFILYVLRLLFYL